MKCFLCGKTDTKLHAFPKSKERFVKWLYNIGRQDVLSDPRKEMKVHTNSRLCPDHFADWCYTCPEKKSLIKTAEPCKPHNPAKVSGQAELRNHPFHPEESSSSSDPYSFIYSVLNGTQTGSVVSETKVQYQTSIASNARRRDKEKSLLNVLQHKVTVLHYEFILSQIGSLKCLRKGKPWTAEDKARALQIYLQHPSVYKLLVKYLNFPPKRVLKDSTGNFARSEGFSPTLQKCLAQQSRKMAANSKLCIIGFDQIELKSGLIYDGVLDKVVGFADQSSTNAQSLATHALVFMAKGIFRSWKQPIGYFFSGNLGSPILQSHYLEKLLFQAIQFMQDANFKVVGVVSIQNPTMENLFRHLKITFENPYIEYQNQKIFVFYDPLQLAKSACSILKRQTFYFGEKFASWSPIEQFYELDRVASFRMTDLTEEHMTATSFEDLDISFTADVFTHRLAAGVYMYCHIHQLLPAESIYTCEFLKEMEELLNAMNSRKLQNPKKWESVLFHKSCHESGWQRKIDFIQSWKCEESEPGSYFSPPCKEGWLVTVAAIRLLWDSLKDCLPYLQTSNLNLSCLRKRFKSKLSASVFVQELRAEMNPKTANERFAHPGSESCEAKLLIDFTLLLPSTFSELFTDSSNDTYVLYELGDLSEELELNLHEDDTIIYFSSYLVRKILDMVDNCETCANALKTPHVLDFSKLLDYFAFVNECKVREVVLNMPTKEFLKFITGLSKVFDKNYVSVLTVSSISHHLYTEMCKQNFPALNQHEHKTFVRNYAVKSYLKVMLKYKIKMINQTTSAVNN